MFLGFGFGYNDRQMKPALHVQIIRTVWTKRSRGAPAATARAGVPLWLPVKANLLEHGNLGIETYDFGEPDFAAPLSGKIERLNLEPNCKYENGAFLITWNNQAATTFWQWSNYHVGAPEPQIFNSKLGRYEVAPDNWVRLRWHGRFSDQDTGKWWYEQTVVNVARCDAELNVDFSGEPARSFEWLPSLR